MFHFWHDVDIRARISRYRLRTDLSFFLCSNNSKGRCLEDAVFTLFFDQIIRWEMIILISLLCIQKMFLAHIHGVFGKCVKSNLQFKTISNLISLFKSHLIWSRMLRLRFLFFFALYDITKNWLARILMKLRESHFDTNLSCIFHECYPETYTVDVH